VVNVVELAIEFLLFGNSVAVAVVVVFVVVVFVIVAAVVGAGIASVSTPAPKPTTKDTGQYDIEITSR
jgi:hypothetical protein